MELNLELFQIMMHGVNGYCAL